MPHLLDYYLDPLTLPGHQPGAAGQQPMLSIEDMAAYVRGELKSMEKQSVILMGHSMGALAALEAAADPAVAGLVLMGAASAMPVNEDLLKQAAADPQAANEMICKWSISSASPQADAIRTIMGAIQRTVDPAMVAADLRACDHYKNGATAAAAIAKPVLVIAGERDKMVSAASGNKLADMCQRGRFVQLDNCGHMPMIEQPIETADHIRHFINAEDVFPLTGQ